MEKISVIIPIYNAEKTLEKCIISVINQSKWLLEIILIDDGSNDKSLQICNEFKNRNEKIFVITQRNQGVSAARNKGIQLAKGQYISFVDSDDWLEPDFYEYLHCNIEKYNADISICGVFLNYPNGKQKKDSNQEMVQILNSKEAIECMLKNNPFAGFLWNRLYRRELFDNLLLDEKIAMCEDVLISVDLFDRSNKIVYSSKAKYHYFQSGVSFTTKDFTKERLTGILAFQFIEEQIKKKYPSLLNLAGHSLFVIKLDCALAILNSSLLEKYEKEFFSLKKDLKKSILKNFTSLTLKSIFKVIILLAPLKVAESLMKFARFIIKRKI
ncbi:glycosyltransferase family 2 protein [Anaerosinus massiliensis]|uniref:glycosyltransferase family 2 protein n=1 Tax=Massilibacillus massiliensis TaxID=1806837 RepID=UPI000DA60F61|nr:glycosyltransferase family 2 protein [Massilibacillus massiliensis]